MRSRRTVAEGRHRIAQWRHIAIEVVKQSRRSAVPTLHDPVSLADALTLVGGYDLILVLWEGEYQRTILRRRLHRPAPRPGSGLRGTGGRPRGRRGQRGSPAGAVPVSLGRLIMRTEPEGLTAVSMVPYELAIRCGIEPEAQKP